MSRPFWNSFLINFFTQYNGRKFVRNFSTAIAALKFFSSKLKKKLFFVVALLLRHLKPLSNAHENFAGKDRWELFLFANISRIFWIFRSSEMVFLPDMSEGETSDGDAYNEDEQAMNTMNTNNSNFNTLETMSARSFGFIKPSQKAQDNDLVNRIRRHKSFFNAETSGNSSTKTRARVQMHAHGNFHFWTWHANTLIFPHFSDQLLFLPWAILFWAASWFHFIL